MKIIGKSKGVEILKIVRKKDGLFYTYLFDGMNEKWKLIQKFYTLEGSKNYAKFLGKLNFKSVE